MKQNQSLSKKAVDSVAKDYWTSYYTDSGYGALWVRDIPKRVKASLEKDASLKPILEKTAAEQLVIRPIVSVPTENGGQSLEAIAVLPNKNRIAFVIDFDAEGNVTAFETVSANA